MLDQNGWVGQVSFLELHGSNIHATSQQGLGTSFIFLLATAQQE